MTNVIFDSYWSQAQGNWSNGTYILPVRPHLCGTCPEINMTIKEIGIFFFIAHMVCVIILINAPDAFTGRVSSIFLKTMLTMSAIYWLVLWLEAVL